jgi:prepilin signal peptidase PulO-like enzyme (type II secretory pathway)
VGELSRGTKQVTMKSEIPFGPFLILGTLIMFLASDWATRWLGIVIFW